MLILLALPIFCGAAVAHRYLQLYGPSNVVVRRVRYAPPRLGTAAALLLLAATLLLAMHVIAQAIASGAPGWLNLVVLVLAWDAIKFACLAIGVVLRALASAVRRVLRRMRSVAQRERQRSMVDPGRSHRSAAERRVSAQ